MSSPASSRSSPEARGESPAVVAATPSPDLVSNTFSSPELLDVSSPELVDVSEDEWLQQSVEQLRLNEEGNAPRSELTDAITSGIQQLRVRSPGSEYSEVPEHDEAESRSQDSISSPQATSSLQPNAAESPEPVFGTPDAEIPPSVAVESSESVGSESVGSGFVGSESVGSGSVDSEVQEATQTVEPVPALDAAGIQDEIVPVAREYLENVPVEEISAVESTVKDDSIRDASLNDIPATNSPATDIPDTEVPAADVPAADVPVTNVPVTGVPVTNTPATDIPAADIPAADVPGTPDTPVTYTPVTATSTSRATLGSTQPNIRPSIGRGYLLDADILSPEDYDVVDDFKSIDGTHESGFLPVAAPARHVAPPEITFETFKGSPTFREIKYMTEFFWSQHRFHPEEDVEEVLRHFCRHADGTDNKLMVRKLTVKRRRRRSETLSAFVRRVSEQYVCTVDMAYREDFRSRVAPALVVLGLKTNRHGFIHHHYKQNLRNTPKVFTEGRLVQWFQATGQRYRRRL